MNAPQRRSGYESASEIKELSLTEAEVIPIVFVNGGTIKASEGNLLFIGWQDCPEFKERRIVVRLIVPMSAAKDLILQANGLLSNGHH